MSPFCKTGYYYANHLHKMKNQLKIREYTPNDFETIIEIWDKLDMGRVERGDTKDVIEKTLKNNAKLFLLEKDNKIIGTSWITSDSRRLYLHHFGILAEYQGNGYSKPLLEKSLDFAQEQGMQVKLEVYEGNNIAINLYNKYGFKHLFKDYIVLILRDFE